MPPVSLRRVHGAIERLGAGWSAGPTDVARLPAAERAGLCGVVVDEAALQAALRPGPRPRAPVTFDPAVDWRDRRGNHVTAVENQQRCGSCVSFATAALVGSMASIEHGRLLDLSEADLHFCSPHGATCGGWWPEAALAWAREPGLVEDRHFPYGSAFSTPPAPDPAAPGTWQPRCAGVGGDGRRVRIARSGPVADVAARKAHLTKVGPMVAIIEVFDDLYAYRNGVYTHATGASRGLHAVLVVGYSEADQAWLVKNSWGPGWGDGGFGRIAYGEVGIDTRFPFWGASGVTLPAEEAWFGWGELGGQVVSGVGACAWGRGRLDLVARGPLGTLVHRAYDGRWQPWEDLGGTFDGTPAACAPAPGRIEVAVRGLGNQLLQRSFDRRTGWGGWVDRGGALTSSPALASWSPARLDAFARDADGGLVHAWCAAAGRWEGWEQLGGALDGAPAAAARPGQRLDVVARGARGGLVHRAFDGARWLPWQDVDGETVDAPALVATADGALELLVRAPDNRLRARRRAGATWGPWRDLEGRFDGPPGAASWGGSRLDVVVRGLDNRVWQRWRG